MTQNPYELPKSAYHTPLLVQEYLADPFLIDGCVAFITTKMRPPALALSSYWMNRAVQHTRVSTTSTSHTPRSCLTSERALATAMSHSVLLLSNFRACSRHCRDRRSSVRPIYAHNARMAQADICGCLRRWCGAHVHVHCTTRIPRGNGTVRTCAAYMILHGTHSNRNVCVLKV